MGGRSAAVALGAAGLDVTVLEREPDLAGRGAGIVLQPHVVERGRQLGHQYALGGLE